MNQRSPMRNLITDKELILACDLTTKVEPYQLSSQIPGLSPAPGMLWDSRNSRDNYPGKPVIVDSLFQLHHTHEWKIVTAAHWERINYPNDYMGVILVHEQKRLLLLAHRGMQFSTSNMANCLNIALNQYVPITEDAINMCRVAIELISARYQGFTLCHTGFSMGGFLAQITASYCNHLHNGMHNEAICYDSPGAEHAINSSNYKDNRSNIIIYLTSPNLVNTGNPHYGYVRQITQWHGKNEYEGKLRALTVDKPFVLLVHKLGIDENLAVVDASMKSHLRLFKETYTSFNAQNNFDFLHVQTWPVAINKFNYKQTGSTQLDIPKSTSFEEILINFGNLCAEYQVQKIAFEAGMPEIESVIHQIMNPQIILSAEPFIHGNGIAIDLSPISESTTPVYSSPFATVSIPPQNNNEAPTKLLNHPPGLY